METIRAFISVDLPYEVKRTIAKIQIQFKGLGLKTSWVKPENVHLTLKFLGNVSENQVKKPAACTNLQGSYLAAYANGKEIRPIGFGRRAIKIFSCVSVLAQAPQTPAK